MPRLIGLLSMVLAFAISTQTFGQGVTSFNTRTGAVTLSSTDVTTSLAYLPAHSGANSDITSLFMLPSATSTYPQDWFKNGGGVTGSTVNINYLNDRIFVADATVNNGVVGNTSDWLSQLPGDPSGIVQNCQVCIETTNGLIGIVSGSQALNAPFTTTPVLGASFFAQNDNGSAIHSVWGLYGEGRMTENKGMKGATFGAELDGVNYSGIASTMPTPFHQYPNNYVGDLQLAAGGGLSGADLMPTTFAINIANNGTTHDVGVMFDSTALSGNNGSSGFATAIAMPKGDTVAWYDSTATSSSNFIVGNASTHTVGSSIWLQDGNTIFTNGSAQTSVVVQTPASATNMLNLFGSATMQSVGLSASGSDSSISIAITPKDGGAVVINGPLRVAPTTVSGLSTFDPTPSLGDRAMVTDATTCVFNSVVKGGGSIICPVIYTGSWVGG